MEKPTQTSTETDRSNADPQRLAVQAHVHRVKAVAALSPKSKADLAPATPLELSQQQLELEENPKLRNKA